ncbi:hypothetical protein L6452_21430 [Arctium lappa]|uniref:Uncharacterized protein n=1 Tax=Arctium lappa TaxID=4217 RepID=A0ACB9AYC3_ARCLA|nr:hypothetical protein L6452_21430 [Arctium lappa]
MKITGTTVLLQPQGILYIWNSSSEIVSRKQLPTVRFKPRIRVGRSGQLGERGYRISKKLDGSVFYIL